MPTTDVYSLGDVYFAQLGSYQRVFLFVTFEKQRVNCVFGK